MNYIKEKKQEKEKEKDQSIYIVPCAHEILKVGCDGGLLSSGLSHSSITLDLQDQCKIIIKNSKKKQKKQRYLMIVERNYIQNQKKFLYYMTIHILYLFM